MSMTEKELFELEDTIKLVNIINGNNFSEAQLKFMLDCFHSGISVSSLEVIACPEFAISQMGLIIYALYIIKLPKDIVSKYANPDIEYNVLAVIFEDLSNNVPTETIDDYVQLYFKSGAESVFKTREKLLRHKQSKSQVQETDNQLEKYNYFIAYSYMDECDEIAFDNCFMDLTRKIKSKNDINQLQSKIADKYALDSVTIINYIINE